MAGRLTGIARHAALAVTVVLTTAAFASDFEQTAGPTGGRVMSMTTDAGNAWALTLSGDIFHSTDDGVTWEHVQATGLPQQTTFEQIININGLVLLVRERVNIHRSTDGGATWSQIGVDFANTASSELIIDGPAAIAHLRGAEDRLFITHDSGATWNPVPLPFTNLQGVFFKDDVLLVSSTSSNELRLFAAGNWIPVGSELPADLYQRFAVGQPALVLQCVFSGQFFRSTNIGATWTEITPPFAGGSFLGPFGVADGNTVMYAAVAPQSELTVYRSADDGATWVQAAAVGLPDIAVSSSSPLPLASDHGATVLLGYAHSGLGVFRSSDGAATWNDSNQGLIATMLDAIGVVGDTLLTSEISLESNFRSLDDGESWQRDDQLPNVIAYESLDQSTVFAGSQGSGVFRSQDAGLTWAPVNTGLPTYNSPAGGVFEPINDFAAHDGFLFAATGGGSQSVTGDVHCGCTTTISGDGVYRSSNNGASWQRVSSGLPINFIHFGDPILRPITALLPVNGALLAATPAHGVYRTTNNGSTWQPTAGAPGGTDLVLFNGEVYLADGTGMLYRSTNDGTSWSVVATNLPRNFTFRGLHVHDGVMYAIAGSATFAVPNGIYSTTDGSSWVAASTALADVPVSDIASRGDELVVATAGRGAWIMPAFSPADVNSDGAVDVFDLFDVLGAWGACAPPCPPTCAEDANGDCTIDIFDLIEVLSAWTG